MIRIATTGLIGYETARRLLDEHSTELKERFSRKFVADFLKLSSENVYIDVESLTDEAGIYTDSKLMSDISAECGLTNDNFKVYITTISEGGLFAALWRACESLKKIMDSCKAAGQSPAGEVPGRENCSAKKVMNASSVGCEVDLNSICIRQEVIEISELYDENPYESPSNGAWVIVWDEDMEEALPEHLQHLLKAANTIGRITKKNDRILIDGDSVRFLTPPARQAKDIKDRKRS